MSMSFHLFTPLSEHCGITNLELFLIDTKGESNSDYPAVLKVTDTWIVLFLEKKIKD